MRPWRGAPSAIRFRGVLRRLFTTAVKRARIDCIARTHC